jgi:hypothetical protein
MAEMLPPGVAVRGLFDSPLWVNEQPAAASIVPLQNETQAVYGLVNATARLGAACAAAYPAPEEQWKCLFGQYRIAYVQTPYLLSASQARAALQRCSVAFAHLLPPRLLCSRSLGTSLLPSVRQVPAAVQRRRHAALQLRVVSGFR